jgi:hypothetical protein
VRDSEGNPVTMTAGGELLRGDAAPGAAGVDLAAFSRWLRANLPAIKREAPPKASKIDPDDPRILRTFAKTPAMPVAKPDVSELAQSLVPPGFSITRNRRRRAGTVGRRALRPCNRARATDE